MRNLTLGIDQKFLQKLKKSKFHEQDYSIFEDNISRTIIAINNNNYYWYGVN